MPFTFSHPALVLPLAKFSGERLSLTGLVVGSIAPDFEYFITMGTQSSISHTIAGLFWFDVPLGVLLTFVFHNIIRNSLYDNLPLALRRRLLAYKSFNWNAYFRTRWLTVVISILVGAASHLFWDAFTHNRAYFVVLFPELNSSGDLMGWSLPYYRILQHVSTILGAIVIGVFIFKMPKVSDTPDKSGNPRYWPIVSVMAAMIVVLRLSMGIGYSLSEQVVVIVTTTTSAIIIALIITPFLFRKKNKDS